MVAARLTLALIASTLCVACAGHSSDESSEAQSEKARIGQEIANAGTPSSSWSDPQLAEYEAKLDRFKFLEKQFPDADAKGLGEDLNTLRAFAETARLQHQLDAIGMEKDPIAPADVSTSAALIAENDRLLDELLRDGYPNLGWSEERLKAINEKADKISANADKLATMPSTDERQAAISKSSVTIDFEAAAGILLEKKSGTTFNQNARNAY